VTKLLVDAATLFDPSKLGRFSQIMGRTYDLAKMALTSVDSRRAVPVLVQQGVPYSGFHQGAGETTVAELLQADLPQYSIVLIDEVESSLHPRTQRRLIRDLADKCRDREWQVVLTTHSSYVLAELPPEARAYIMQVGSVREVIYGVSPEFAMTKMDDVPQPECDLYVEDPRAQTLLTEILIRYAPKLVQRCQIIPYGAASVGQALGQMVDQRRFPRRSRVYLDGDQAPARGCVNLPGDDAPERVVFDMLRLGDWYAVAQRVGRPHADVADACTRAMAISDHHEWVSDAATKLILGSDTLWQAMSAEWATRCLSAEDAAKITQPVDDVLIGIEPDTIPALAKQPELKLAGVRPARPETARTGRGASATGQGRLFEQ
jgi:hypothetical protein